MSHLSLSSLKHSSMTEVVISIHLWLISVDWFSRWSLFALGDRGSGPLLFFLSFLYLFSPFLFCCCGCSGFRRSSSLVDVGFEVIRSRLLWRPREKKAQLEVGRLLGNSGLIRTWDALIFARRLWNGVDRTRGRLPGVSVWKSPIFLQAELLWVKPPFLILLTHFNQTQLCV